MGQYAGIIVLVVLFVLMYFFMIRPQKKQQQKHKQTLSTLKKGDKVVTIGRLHGVVDNIDKAKNLVTLDCDGVYLEFDLSAIANVNEPTAAPAKKADKKEADQETAADAEATEPKEEDK